MRELVSQNAAEQWRKFNAETANRRIYPVTQYRGQRTLARPEVDMRVAEGRLISRVGCWRPDNPHDDFGIPKHVIALIGRLLRRTLRCSTIAPDRVDSGIEKNRRGGVLSRIQRPNGHSETVVDADCHLACSHSVRTGGQRSEDRCERSCSEKNGDTCAHRAPFSWTTASSE